MIPPAHPDRPTQPASLPLVWLVFLALLLSLGLIYKPYFPLEGGRMGSDYMLILPNWLDGQLWFNNNGLGIPWFSPSFCAGQPLFPDPQSAYYSVPQFLSMLMEPVTAAFLTLCLSAATLFWGAYLLMRCVFKAGTLAALLTGGLLMLNGFLPHRMLIGHLGFHGFALVPWIGLLLLAPVKTKTALASSSLAAGTMLAYWIHSGFGVLVLPGATAILMLALLHALRGGAFREFLLRAGIAFAMGAALSASKLVAAFSFLSYFPRASYPLPGASSIHEAVEMILAALFMDSQSAASFGEKVLINVHTGQWPNEWAFNFGMASAGLFLIIFTLKLPESVRRIRLPSTRETCLLTALLFCLVLPLALNVFSLGWNAFLKTVPVIKSSSTLLRWILVYLPIFVVALGLMLQGTDWKRWKIYAVGICLFATVLQSAVDSREYYAWQNYDSRGITLAHKGLEDGSYMPGIKELGDRAEIRSATPPLVLSSNNLIAANLSPIRCYNAMFGYKLENFSAEGLAPGPVLAARDDYLNLKNPACYVYPEENNCKPGDRFHADQLEEARKFVNYKPFAFNFSEKQKWANLISYVSLILLVLALLAWACWRLAAIRPRRTKHPATM